MGTTKEKVFYAWNKIGNAEDMRRAKLSSNDYLILTDCLKELFAKGETQTFIKSVADWCLKQKLNVSLSDGINYTIKF
jgi:hypothetical protein